MPEGALTELGEGEGEVEVVAWAGYVEDGVNDPGRRLGDALRGGDRLPGQRHPGQHVRRDVHAHADRQLRRGLGVRRCLQPAHRLGRGRSPSTSALIPNYADVFEGLKNQPHNTRRRRALRRAPRPRRQPADVQHRRQVDPGARLLVASCATPRRLGRAVSGKVTAYDSPIYIADAAVYLMATQPELGITNPYALDETQFAGGRRPAQAAARASSAATGRLYTDEIAALPGGRSTVAARRGRSPPTSLQGSRAGHAGRGRPAQGGLDRLVRHVDAVVRRPSTPTAATCS